MRGMHLLPSISFDQFRILLFEDIDLFLGLLQVYFGGKVGDKSFEPKR